MPAGTSLERGLLQGMKDSCGAVFFITPSFKDENFLATEIDYAIQEKRAKGDRFALITLQFVDHDGKMGTVPDLLRPYVWKTPKTDIEAMREIVRALPVEPGLVDWRDGIDGVVQLPKVNSVSEELSEEAKAILLEAVASQDGQLFILEEIGGQSIHANDKSLIPDQSPRTEALWFGGLEELQRRRYIIDTEHKGESFRVTKEGYEAADSLSAE